MKGETLLERFTYKRRHQNLPNTYGQADGKLARGPLV